MTIPVRTLTLFVIILLAAGCGATAQQVIPTARPSLTPTLTTTITPTPDDVEPTAVPTTAVPESTSGPSPTPLFGPTRTPSGTQTVSNPGPRGPNAPRIEFFRANAEIIAPGDSATLFWSVRGVQNAVIYRLDSSGQRTVVYNIPPDGSETIQTTTRERSGIEFLLVAGEGAEQVEQSVIIRLACPITWFFEPPPEDCPNEEPQPAQLVEMPFERGRMLYNSVNNRVYALFNDGRSPAWVSFENRYDPAVHPELDENFERALVGTSFKQPLGSLGFVWRGNDSVRTRLGNGTAEELRYDGFSQTAPLRSGSGQSLYISSSDAKVIQLLPGGDQWQIITPN